MIIERQNNTRTRKHSSVNAAVKRNARLAWRSMDTGMGGGSWSRSFVVVGIPCWGLRCFADQYVPHDDLVCAMLNIGHRYAAET